MKSVHKVDGKVIVTDGATVYTETEANFTADYGSAYPAYLKAGAFESYYNLDTPLHRECGPWGTEQYSTPWAAGDAIHADLTNLMAAKATRDDPGPDPPNDLDLSQTALDARTTLGTRGSGTAVDVGRDEFNTLLDALEL